MADGSVSMRDPRIGLDNLNLRVDLAGTRATISQLSGDLNGGNAQRRRHGRVRQWQPSKHEPGCKGTDVYMDVPEGLKTVSDIDLTLTNGPNETVVVAGEVAFRKAASQTI